MKTYQDYSSKTLITIQPGDRVQTKDFKVDYNLNKEQSNNMAKVIGKDKTVVRKCSCVGCGALIEYYRNDVSSQYYTDYDGGGDTQYWINCPGCCKRIIVKPWY